MERDASHRYSTSCHLRIAQANVSQHADSQHRINQFCKLASTCSCDAQSNAGQTAPNDPNRTYTCKLGGRGSSPFNVQLHQFCTRLADLEYALDHAGSTAAQQVGSKASHVLPLLFLRSFRPYKPFSCFHSPQRWL